MAITRLHCDNLETIDWLSFGRQTFLKQTLGDGSDLTIDWLRRLVAIDQEVQQIPISINRSDRLSEK
jgi:hypothetical protein